MKKSMCIGVGLMILAIVLLVSGGPAYAQDVTGSITGTVSDPSGAAVVGATVTAKDVDRGTVWPATTNESGVYNLLRLPTGSYELKVEATGFQTAVHAAFTLVLNQTARIDITMKVGQVTETVEVTGAAPILKTDTTQVDTVFDAAATERLPLATRNYVQLTLLAPGAVTPNPGGFNTGDNTANGSRPYINGNREQSNNFLLDGMDNNQVSDNLLGYTPAPDAIQEFNLITNNASAEFGNFQGGIVSTTIKSGTNSLHGDVWEFFRNDVLNANKWENNWQGSPKAKLRWNMFGGTLGGPIVKNKLFFFVDYQGQRFDHPGTTSAWTVFTDAERAGDFSSLCQGGFDSGGVCLDRNSDGQVTHQLYNPCASFTAVCTPESTPAGTRQPFANNQIPVAMLSPVAQALFASSFYPSPVNDLRQNNAFQSTNSQNNADQGDVKIDYKISDRDRISWRYSQAFQTDPSTTTATILGNGFGEVPIKNTVGDWTHSFGSNLLNDLRFGWSHVTLHNGGTFDNSLGTLGEDLGIANSNPDGTPGLLSLQFPGTSLTSVGNSIIEQNFDDKVYQLNEGLLYTRGRHSFKFGFLFQRQIINTFYSGNSGKLGSMVFGPDFTQSSATNAFSGSGDGGADFYLGLPTNFSRGISSGGWEQSQNIWAGYVQDDWRATDRLTFNLGMRYEAHTPWVEAHDRQVNFGLLSGEVMFAGKDGNSRGLYNGTYGLPDFQPRIGFAWSPSFLSHTVLRGAYTISSYMEGTGTNLRLPINPPFSPAEFLIQYPNAVLPGTSSSDGIVAPPPPDPTCADLSCYDGALIRIWDPNVQPAISQQWNLTIQKQFGGNMTAQIGYVGQHGTHLMVPMPYAQLQSLPNSACEEAPCTAPSIYIAGNPDLASRISQISGTASNGNMRYDALQAVLQKQMSNGLTYQVAYTFSKCMTNNSGYYGSWGAQTTTASPYWQNVYDVKDEWAPCFYDATHVLTAFATYELPFGKGKRFGKDMNAIANAVVGGWSINPIVSLHTGFPLAVYPSSSDPTGTGSRGLRPNCTGTNTVYGKQTSTNADFGGYLWFDTSNYSNPTAVGQFGNCAPALGGLRGPGYDNFDISLYKDFHISEFKKIQFRADFLNAFNHVNLNAPNTTVGDSMGYAQSSQDSRNIQFALKFYF